MMQRFWVAARQLLRFDFAQQAACEMEMENDLIARRIVGRFAHGNVRLQAGSFLTDGELKAELSRLAASLTRSSGETAIRSGMGALSL